MIRRRQRRAGSRKTHALAGQPIATELRGLLRAMNSYHSNRIEGQHTRPHELEQALQRDFSGDAERDLEARYGADRDAQPLYSAAAIADIHRTLFVRLPPEHLSGSEGVRIEPGTLRTREVRVGQHVAPAAPSVPWLLERWAGFYGSVRRGEAALVALAAAHQRMGWIHPFVDGNGRVMRLHTHTVLHALGYTGGVWSPLRGFARSVDRYYALLAAADEPAAVTWTVAAT